MNLGKALQGLTSRGGKGNHLNAAKWAEAQAGGKVADCEAWLSSVGYRDDGATDRRGLAEKLVKFIRRCDDRGLLLVGNPGTGKTEIVRLLCRDVYSYEQYGHIVTNFEWNSCPEIANGYTPDDRRFLADRARKARENIAVYDELMNEKPGAYAFEAMIPIIEARHDEYQRHGHRTIWICNKGADAISARYGPHILDRLRGMSMTLAFTGESQR